MVKRKKAIGESLAMKSWVNQGLASVPRGEEDSRIDQTRRDKYKFDECVLAPDDRAGQSNKLKVRNFDDESYNGPRLEDFLKRLDAIYKTALAEIDNNDQLENKEERKKELTKYKELTVTKITDDCKIESILLVDIIDKEKDVVAKIEQAAKHLRHFVAHALPIVYPEKSMKDAIKEFQQAEAQWTADQGRPDFINQYKLGDSTRVSAQRVVGGSIIPSTKRDEGKLPNFVQVAMGSVDAQGVSDIEFTGYRHSSYPPIKIKDKIERRAMACEAVKDMLTELARQQLQGHDAGEFSVDKPLVINLSSMALLSPIQGDKAFMGEESEHRQLKESQYALMMYNQRPMELTIDGQKVIVKPQINLMNEPANTHGIKIKQVNQILNKIWSACGLPPDLEESINTKGMVSFTTDATNHIHDQIKQIKATTLLASDEHAAEIVKIYEQINTAYQSSEELIQAQEQLNTLLEKNDLTKAYEELEEKQNAYLKAETPKRKEQCAEDYYAQVDKVRKIENELHKAYKAVENQREKVWLKNKDHIAELNKKIVAYLGNEDNRIKMQSGNGESLKKLFQFMQLYHQAEAINFSKDGQPHEFASRYLLVNQLMDKSVDWFCKSGEDRTGRLHNFIEELCGFSAEEGHFPDYDFVNDRVLETDRKQQQQIAKTVVEFSVSRDICGENAHGARGIQQSSMEVNAGLPNRSGYAVARLAKTSLYQPKLLKKVEHEELQQEDELEHEGSALRKKDIPALDRACQRLNDEILHKGKIIRTRYQRSISKIMNCVDEIKRINTLLSAGGPINHGQLIGHLKILQEKTANALIKIATESEDVKKQTTITEIVDTIVPVFSRMIDKVKSRERQLKEQRELEGPLESPTAEKQYTQEDSALQDIDIFALETACDRLDEEILHDEDGKIRKKYQGFVSTITRNADEIDRINTSLSEGVPTNHGQLVQHLEALEKQTSIALIGIAGKSEDPKKRKAIQDINHTFAHVFSQMIQAVKLRERQLEEQRELERQLESQKVEEQGLLSVVLPAQGHALEEEEQGVPPVVLAAQEDALEEERPLVIPKVEEQGLLSVVLPTPGHALEEEEQGVPPVVLAAQEDALEERPLVIPKVEEQGLLSVVLPAQEDALEEERPLVIPKVEEQRVPRVVPPDKVVAPPNVQQSLDTARSFRERLGETKSPLTHKSVNTLIESVATKHKAVSDNAKKNFLGLFAAKHKKIKDEYLKAINIIKERASITPEEKLIKFTQTTEEYMNKLAKGQSVRYLDNLRETLGMDKLETHQDHVQAWAVQDHKLKDVLEKMRIMQPAHGQEKESRTIDSANNSSRMEYK